MSSRKGMDALRGMSFTHSTEKHSTKRDFFSWVLFFALFLRQTFIKYGPGSLSAGGFLALSMGLWTAAIPASIASDASSADWPTAGLARPHGTIQYPPLIAPRTFSMDVRSALFHTGAASAALGSSVLYHLGTGDGWKVMVGGATSILFQNKAYGHLAGAAILSVGAVGLGAAACFRERLLAEEENRRTPRACSAASGVIQALDALAYLSLLAGMVGQFANVTVYPLYEVPVALWGVSTALHVGRSVWRRFWG